MLDIVIAAKRGKKITKSLTAGKPSQVMEERDKQANEKIMSGVNPVKEIIWVLSQKGGAFYNN